MLYYYFLLISRKPAVARTGCDRAMRAAADFRRLRRARRDHRKTTARPMATRVSDIQFKVEAMGAATPTHDARTAPCN